MKNLTLFLVALFALAISSQAQLQVSITGSTSFCQGSSTDLTAVASGGTSPYEFLWSNGDTSLTITVLSGGSYSVTVTDQLGDTVSTQAGVTELPAPTVGISGAPITVCGGGCVTLAAYGTGATYTWTPPTGLSCVNCANPVACPFSTTTYTITTTAMNGCTASTTATITVSVPINVDIDTMFVEICQGDSVTLTAYGAANYLWSNGQSGPSITVSPLVSTVYYVSGTDLFGCVDVDSVMVSVFNCSSLMPKAGVVYEDINANGVRDVGEPPISGVILTESPYQYYFITNDSGEYHAYYDTGAPTLTYNNPYQYCTYSPMTHVITGPNDTTNDFGIHCVYFADVAVAVTAVGATPGLGMSYSISVSNLGNQVMSGTVSFAYENAVTFINATEPPTIFGDSLVWTFTNLQPGTSHTYWTYFVVSPGLMPGYFLESHAYAFPLQDSLPANNIDNHWIMVTGSFDPNDKAVSDTVISLAEIANEPYLYYTIRFQNCGNDSAINIEVRDTLDQTGLQVPSIHTIFATHPYTFSMEQNGTAVWTFENIMLPDSNVDEAGSHGLIHFMVRANGSLTLGSTIENKAGIYFDFNTPVITNTVLTVIEETSAIGEHLEDGSDVLGVYPNPTTGILTLFFGGLTESKLLHIIDMSGQLVFELSLECVEPINKEAIDLSAFPEGVYVIQLIGGSGVQTRKVVVLR